MYLFEALGQNPHTEESYSLTSTSMENPNKTPPTHEVWHVRNTPDQEKGFWTKVGAMWQHKDGKGFDIVFEIQVADPLYLQVERGKRTLEA